MYAPGRINLIGEHTDYNNGFAMPAAMTWAFGLGSQKLIHHYFPFIQSINNQKILAAGHNDLVNSKPGNWFNYPARCSL